MSAGVSIGVGLVLAGLALLVLFRGFLRILPRPQTAPPSSSDSHLPFPSQTHDAIVVIQAGGRVEYMNAPARERFGVPAGETPDLERLARHVRPSETFIELCAAEGRKRISINGRLTEATSYRVPGYTPLVLLSLRSMELASAFTGKEGADEAASVIKVIAEFGQTVHSDLRLEPTLLSIFQGVSRLVSTDVMEIKLLDADGSVAHIHRYEENSENARALITRNSQFGPYTDALLKKRDALFLPADRQEAPASTPRDTRGRSLVKAYIGALLIAEDQLIGTLEIGQTAAANFNEHDFELLKLTAGQAGTALRNALRYEEEQARLAEFTGLARLAQATTSVQDSQELFTRLVGAIVPLFNIQVVGFLLYNEADRKLEAQNPFQGLPANVVAIYHSLLSPGGPGESILQSGQPLLAEDTPNDANMHALGLAEIAQLASLRETALFPLISNGRTIGYLQLANHRGASPVFTSEEQRLARAIAGQAASLIDNAILIQQARQRGQRSEALRRIASLVASSATLDEILQFSVQELASLLKADMASIYLLDPQTHELGLHLPSTWGIPVEKHRRLARIDVNEMQLRRTTVSGTHRPFISGRLSADERISAAYRGLLETVIVESCIIVPLMARERSVGELMLGSRKTDFFNAYDLQILATAAGLLAAAVEGAALLTQTDESLRRRVEQLTAITHVTRELNSSPSVKQLLEIVYEQSIHTTRADCGTILLFDPEFDPADPRVTFRLGCAEDPLSPLTRRVLASGEAALVSNFETALLNPPHLDVNSALAAPILRQGRVRGVIHLHAARSGYFDAAALETVETLAMQASIALGNAERYQEQYLRAEQLLRRAATLAHFANLTSVINYEQPLEQSLLNIATAIQEATPFQVALISVYEPETGLLRRVAGVGFSTETIAELFERKQPLQGIQQLLRPEFKIGRVYFIPADQTPVIPAEVHTIVTAQPENTTGNPNAWNEQDFLLCLLEDPQGRPLGLLSVDAPRDRLRPDRATLETVEIFASQCSLAILSQHKLGELRERIDSLNSGLQRQQKLLSISQNDLPILLRKDMEQTIAVQDLERRTRRIRAGLAIAESVSRQMDPASALLALGRETLTQLNMSIALIAEETQDGPRLLHVLGSTPKNINVDALFGQRNPLRVALQNGETLIVPNLDENDEWRDSGLLTALRAKGIICLPLTIEKQTVAGLLAISAEPLAGLTEEDMQVYYQIARQTSVVLQNMSLLNETRQRLQEVNLLLDFSRQLSNLEPDEIVRSLLESALRVLPAAHAGSVLLWDVQTIRLTPRAVAGYADNASMQKLSFASGEALPGIVYTDGRPRRVDEVNFTRDYPLGAESLLQYRQGTGGRLPISSLLIPIQAGEQGLGVLVLDNFNTPAAFKPGDETLLISLAQQVALSLENVRLVQATQERAGQLQALTDVASTISSSLQSRELIGSLLNQLEPVLPFDTATLWLRDKEQLTVNAARGFPDSEPRIGISVNVVDSTLFKQVIRTSQPILVGDVREDPRFPTLEAPRLSWMGIPLVAKSEVIGLIALEKWQANFYNNESTQVAATFASQAAVALENARLFEESVNRAAELDERSQRLALLNRFSSALSGLLDADQILELTAQETLNALNALRISIIGIERGRSVLTAVVPRTRRALAKETPDSPVLTRLRESQGVYTSDNVHTEAELASLRDFLGNDTMSLMILALGAGETRRLLLVHGGPGTRFGLNEIELARTLGNQASIALENTRLYQSTARTAERLEILNTASSEISSSLDPEEIYTFIHKAAQQLMPVEAFVIALLDKEAQDIEGVYLFDNGARLENQRLPLRAGLTGQVINSGEPLLVHTIDESNALGAVDIGDTQPAVSIIAVPMNIGNETIGVLSAQSYQQNVYSEDDLQVLGTLANQAIVAIQNGHLFAETQRLAEELEERVEERTAQLQHEQQNTETLLRILTEVSSSLDLDRALNRTLALLNEAIGAEQGTIMLLHQDDNKLHFRAGYGYLTSQAVAESRATVLNVGEGLAGWVVEHREAALIEDLHHDSRWVRPASGTREHRSSIVAPMLVVEDVIGVLMAFHRQPSHFTAESLNLVRAIASQVAVAINNARLYELIRDQAERLGTMLRKEQEDASRSQAILEAVADGVLVTGVNNRFTFLNSSAQSILRMTDKNILDQPLDAFGGLFGKAASAWIETIRAWSEEPASYQGDTYAEQLELDDKRIVLVHLAPVMLQNDFLGTVSIFRDITHEVEVDRLKSEFVATVSHELRTPMTSIRGYADILLMGAAGALNENQSHFLSIIKNNTERLNILVNDLLDISRIEAGRVTLSPQSIDLREVAEDVLADVLRRSQEENKPMGVTLEAPKELPRVYGDSERVRQILDNLVDNAYHYTPPNGQIQVRLFTANNENEVQVDVLDTGVGIVIEDQQRVFDRFFRGEHPLVLATPGTGLGLPIVRQLVEMHNGKIWMSSKGIPGEGSVFSFTLPVYNSGKRGKNGKNTDR